MLDVKFSVNMQFPSDYFYFQKASKCISNKFVMFMAFTKHPLPMPLQTRKTYFVNYIFGGGGVGFGFCPYSCIPLMHMNI